MAQRQRKTGIEFVAVCIACLVTCSAALGQELGSLEWFKKEWKAASKWNVPAFTLLEHDQTIYSYVTAEEVRALAALIDGKPEHPRRREYEEKVALFRDPNPKNRLRTWYGRDGYRQSSDIKLTDGQSLTSDEVTRKSVAWLLRPGKLSVSDPRVAPPGQGYESRLASAKSDARRFVFSGMGGSVRVKHRILSSQLDEQGNWQGRTESTDGNLAFAWAGRHDKEHNTILIESSRVTKATGFEFLLNIRWEFSEWEHSAFFDKPIAHKAVRFQSDGKPFLTIELVDFTQVSSGDFELLTQVPSSDTPDMIRGEYAVNRRFDQRPSVQEMQITMEDGTMDVRSIRPFEEEASSWRGRIIGVLVASIAIGGVWVIRYRRR